MQSRPGLSYPWPGGRHELTLPALTAGNAEEFGFVDEESLSAVGKQQILADWQRFIGSGFKKLFFTRELYRFLHHTCDFMTHTGQDGFWAYYFNSDVDRLHAFLSQFGYHGRSAETGTPAWLAGPAADLKGAMCREMAQLYAPLAQVLRDLELKHAELGHAWRAFALRQAQEAPQSSLALDPGYPPHYQVSENARNLLAYAADIARHQALVKDNYKTLLGIIMLTKRPSGGSKDEKRQECSIIGGSDRMSNCRQRRGRCPAIKPIPLKFPQKRLKWPGLLFQKAMCI